MVRIINSACNEYRSQTMEYSLGALKAMRLGSKSNITSQPLVRGSWQSPRHGQLVSASDDQVFVGCMSGNGQHGAPRIKSETEGGSGARTKKKRKG